uniref:DUF659 domain-containing protein n=1 Tax=Meloidogyne enterolobii TaxID=390850 RepID=A0A6V7UJM5_MELEN|nr:unnamed protein product [Meloidogyne enterolobii]
MSQIKQKIGTGYVWCSVDETTDSLGRYVANLIVGKLDSSRYLPPYLVAVKMLEKTNYSTIARFVNESLRQIGISEENVLLLVTDAAAYMCKAARALNVFYPNCIHVTCVCHALHRVAEEIRSCFSEVDGLISNTKKIFTKAPSRVAIYKEKFPALPLPPQPILTRWSSWLEATIFYSNNFHAVKDVVESFDSLDAAAILKAKEFFNNKRITQQLAYINANFSLISTAIKRFEAQGITLAEDFD